MNLTYLLCSKKAISVTGLLTFLILFPGSILQSQTCFFETYGVEQGLGSSKVYTVIQDRNDWIWLGTESGVSRFDGSGFENFTSAQRMAGGGVFCMTEDTLGRIWFGHLNGGLSLYDDGKFFKLKFDSISLDGDITGIRQLKGKIWITTMNNGAILTSFPQKGDTVLAGTQYLGKDGLSDQISGVCIDNSKDFYCITPYAGIKKFIPARNNFETFSPPELTKFFNVIVMFQDSKGNYWYGTHNGGLYKYDVDSGKMRVFDVRDGLSRNMISYITEDYRGNIWAGTFGGGITVFEGEKIKVYDQSNGLEATSVHCIVEDKEKNMIIADHYNGISIYKGDHFLTWSDEKFLPDKSVFAVEQDELGRYWIGTNKGISVYTPTALDGNKVQFFSSAGVKIRFIESDRAGTIWIGTDGSGLSRYDINTRRFTYDTKINSYLHINAIITALILDKSNRLWIGNMDRLVMYDRNKDEISYFSQENGLAGTSITALFCDKDNNIWIGSENKSGLTKYDSQKGEFRKISIGEEYIPKAITQTADGSIWIGTPSGLLSLRNDTIVLNLTEETGLLSNNVKLLQPEGKDYLYVGTNNGLNRYNLRDSTIAFFTKRNGFSGIETNLNASLSDNSGNLWFGTANGITMLNPGLMPPVNKEPVVHISRMEVNYSPRKMENGLRLDYKENSIVFNYYCVSLMEPDAVKFKVMLRGFDPGWKHASSETMQDYSLPPGHYTFMVMASNGYGYWNKKPVEYSFVIKPPFYKSPWFILSAILLAAAGIIIYIKIREKNLIREKKILEAKVAERTAEVVQKSREIEEKNRDITASIRYAERIQRAMLPMENTFPDTFVFYLPKDIVSGDFYWMYSAGDLQFIAACDCTGHGVPGAFMSIIGHNSLDKVVKEYGIVHPGEILDKLNEEVVKALKQRNEETINDGMDLALAVFDRRRYLLEFAGAFNPLYIISGGQLSVYKGDRFPIGMSTQLEEKTFINQLIEIKPGDMIYMCSDGYADQFGSNEVKKFKSGNIKKMLLGIHHLPVGEQREIISRTILEWKGDLPQVDDILFLGMRIPAR